MEMPVAGLLLRPTLVGFSDENLLTAQEWSVRSLCFGLRKRKGAKGAEDQEEVTLTKGKEGNMSSSYREGHPRPSALSGQAETVPQTSTTPSTYYCWERGPHFRLFRVLTWVRGVP